MVTSIYLLEWRSRQPIFILQMKLLKYCNNAKIKNDPIAVCSKAWPAFNPVVLLSLQCSHTLGAHGRGHEPLAESGHEPLAQSGVFSIWLRNQAKSMLALLLLDVTRLASHNFLLPGVSVPYCLPSLYLDSFSWSILGKRLGDEEAQYFFIH